MDGGNRLCNAGAMNERTGQLGSTPLAYRAISGRKAGVVFLGGFHSDMTGDKARYLADWCARYEHPFVRFDYSGHGVSGGRFEDGTISQWLQDAETVILALTKGPQVLVGSSMGGWIALLLALRSPERVKGLAGIAPAPDFTEDLMWANFSDAVRIQIMREGSWQRESAYGGAYPITRNLILDGRRNLLLRNDIPLKCPVRLIHGQADTDVPWRRSLMLAERLASTDVEVTLVKDGDHRLSRPSDLRLLGRALGALLSQDRP